MNEPTKFHVEFYMSGRWWWHATVYYEALAAEVAERIRGTAYAEAVRVVPV